MATKSNLTICIPAVCICDTDFIQDQWRAVSSKGQEPGIYFIWDRIDLMLFAQRYFFLISVYVCL